METLVAQGTIHRRATVHARGYLTVGPYCTPIAGDLRGAVENSGGRAGLCAVALMGRRDDPGEGDIG